MAIYRDGKEYSIEEILAMPEGKEKQDFINSLEIEAEFTGVQEDEGISEIGLHEIRNPKASKEYERLRSSGMSDIQARMHLRNHYGEDFDKEPDEDDKEYSKLKKEAMEARVPAPQMAKVIGYALAHGLSIKEAATEVQIRLTRYTASKGTVPADYSPEEKARMDRETAYDRQQREHKLGKYSPQLQKEREQAIKRYLPEHTPARELGDREKQWAEFNKNHETRQKAAYEINGKRRPKL